MIKYEVNIGSAPCFRKRLSMASYDENISMASSDGENDDVVPRFTIDSETNKQYNRFNARGTELTVRLLPPAAEDNSDAITHFKPV
jgi:hypothetical protein